MRIAAFDSGIGGLTALAPLIRQNPVAEFHYMGDLANLPYGTKSPERVRGLARSNIRWLLKTHAKKKPFDLLIVACNTVSAQALDVVEEECARYRIPCVGVLEPGARKAMSSPAQRIVVLGTPSTVSSQAYVNTLLNLGCPTPVVQRACPLFVPLVEENIVEGPAANWIARHYLDDLLRADDAVILGCTHYPFLQSLLSSLYPGQNWIDAGAALLEDPKVQVLLAQKKPNPDNTGLHLYFTDDTIGEARLKNTFKQLGLPSLIFEVQTVKID